MKGISWGLSYPTHPNRPRWFVPYLVMSSCALFHPTYVAGLSAMRPLSPWSSMLLRYEAFFSMFPSRLKFHHIASGMPILTAVRQ